MKVEQFLNCRLISWYDRFKTLTFESSFLELPDDVLTYLTDDGPLFLPAECEDPLLRDNLEDDTSDNEEWDHDENHASAPKVPSFPEFDEKLKLEIGKLGAVFPKLTWSSPKDAAWMALNGSLKCTTPKEIYLLLKSSSFVAHDLVEPFIFCDDFMDSEDKKQIGHHLVLRKWCDLHIGYEFRVFIYCNRIIAISQRHSSSYFAYLNEEKERIKCDIMDFFKSHICGKFPDDSCVIDVYTPKKNKITLIDFNPYGCVTDALMFTWPEIEGLQESQDCEFRIVEAQDNMQPNPYGQYGVPQDFIDLSHGTDASKLIDLLNLKANQAESSDEDDS